MLDSLPSFSGGVAIVPRFTIDAGDRMEYSPGSFRAARSGRWGRECVSCAGHLLRWPR
jgi:hypothetical protein